MDIMQLGGNIELAGFNDTSKSQLAVLKKIVGNYAKEFSEKAKVGKLSIIMSKEGDDYRITAELAGDKPLKSEASGSNLFFSLGAVLENIKKEL